MPTSVDPTAFVEPGAQLGADCKIHQYAVVNRWAILGDRVTVHPFAVVGGDSQDLKFDGNSESWVRVGSGTRIRESVTINRSTQPGGVTEVGENCLLMACCHVAHDCVVGRDVVIANAVLLAGHVTVGDHAILGGASIYHQFVRIGRGAMVGGGSRVSLDVPPFTLITERNEVIGLNLVGLKRRGASRDSVRELKEAFQEVYRTHGNIREIAGELLSSSRFKTAEARCFLEFFGDGKRGVARPRQDPALVRELDENASPENDAAIEAIGALDFESSPLNAANRALSID
jgi:UDP-N-acetylglucosamine acyltransferase